MSPTFHIGRCRDLRDEFEPSRERSLAVTKLDEFEMWLQRCRPTQEALRRDQAAPAPDGLVAKRFGTRRSVNG